jgi:PncC family amidohydrolase
MCLGRCEELLESKNLAAEIGALLKASGLTVVVTEACTAGLLGYLLTAVSGSSSYFYGGLIAYASSMKRRLLHVPQEISDSHGSVHRLTFLSMAKNVMELSNTDLGISVTGVAGAQQVGLLSGR